MSAAKREDAKIKTAIVGALVCGAVGSALHGKKGAVVGVIGGAIIGNAIDPED